MTTPEASCIEVVARDRGALVWRGRLPHGRAPQTVLHDHGWEPIGLPEVARAEPGRLVLSYAVRPRVEVSEPAGVEAFAVASAHPTDSAHPADSVHPADPVRPADSVRPARPYGVDAEPPRPGERAEQVQRVGAYAVVWSQAGLLATQFSEVTRAAGAWGLPGGGVEPHEDPVEAVARECWEETGQRVDVGRLLEVTSRHWVGRAPSGRLEDFHAVALVYAGTCESPTSPQVHDVGGTTAAAAWVPQGEVAGWPWVPHHAWVTRTIPDRPS